MPYGYLGQNQPNQTVSNSGVFSITDVAELQSQGKLGGSLELIEEQTISSGSTLDFTNLKNYDVLFAQGINIETASSSTPISIRVSNDGGSTFEATNYQYALQSGTTSGSFNEARSTSTTSIPYFTSDSANQNRNAYCYLYNLQNSSKYSFFTYQSMEQANMIFGGGVYAVAETINAIRFLTTNSNAWTGTIKLYGVKQI